MTLPAGVLRGQTRMDTGQDLAEVEQQQVAIFERLQNGGINMLGLRVHVRDVVPIDAPGANQPTLVMVDTGTGPQLYVFTSGAWTPVASAGPGSVALVDGTTGALYLE